MIRIRMRRQFSTNCYSHVERAARVILPMHVAAEGCWSRGSWVIAVFSKYWELRLLEISIISFFRRGRIFGIAALCAETLKTGVKRKCLLWFTNTVKLIPTFLSVTVSWTPLSHVRIFYSLFLSITQFFHPLPINPFETFWFLWFTKSKVLYYFVLLLSYFVSQITSHDQLNSHSSNRSRSLLLLVVINMPESSCQHVWCRYDHSHKSSIHMLQGYAQFPSNGSLECMHVYRYSVFPLYGVCVCVCIQYKSTILYIYTYIYTHPL